MDYDPRAVEAAARYYFVYGLTEKAIVAEYGHELKAKNQTAVSRLLRTARELEVVSFSVDRKAVLRGSKNLALSKDLREQFGLNDAHVFDLPKKLGANDVHTALANHAASDPESMIRIGDGQHVVLAGGRAVCAFAYAFSRKPKLINNVTISPLGGRLWLGRFWILSEGDELERPLNPDYPALVLALGLNSGNSRGTRFSQISHGLHVRDRTAAIEVMKTQCPFLPNGKWNWRLPVPSQAVIGVGVFDPTSGHRLVEFLKKAKGRERGPAFDRLQRAFHLVGRRNGLPYFGDVANRLFAALPRPGKGGRGADSEQAYSKLVALLRQINNQSVVMEWAHLSSILSGGRNGAVNLIAGGPEKLEVLWTALLLGRLHERKRLISSIYTDSETARDLLSAIAHFASAGDTEKQWYRRLTAKVFFS